MNGPSEFTRSVEANPPHCPSPRGFVDRNVFRLSSQIVTALRSLCYFDHCIPKSSGDVHFLRLSRISYVISIVLISCLRVTTSVIDNCIELLYDLNY